MIDSDAEPVRSSGTLDTVAACIQAAQPILTRRFVNAAPRIICEALPSALSLAVGDLADVPDRGLRTVIGDQGREVAQLIRDGEAVWEEARRQPETFSTTEFSTRALSLTNTVLATQQELTDRFPDEDHKAKAQKMAIRSNRIRAAVESLTLTEANGAPHGADLNQVLFNLTPLVDLLVHYSDEHPLADQKVSRSQLLFLVTTFCDLSTRSRRETYEQLLAERSPLLNRQQTGAIDVYESLTNSTTDVHATVSKHHNRVSIDLTLPLCTATGELVHQKLLEATTELQLLDQLAYNLGASWSVTFDKESNGTEIQASLSCECSGLASDPPDDDYRALEYEVEGHCRESFVLVPLPLAETEGSTEATTAPISGVVHTELLEEDAVVDEYLEAGRRLAEAVTGTKAVFIITEHTFGEDRRTASDLVLSSRAPSLNVDYDCTSALRALDQRTNRADKRIGDINDRLSFRRIDPDGERRVFIGQEWIHNKGISTRLMELSELATIHELALDDSFIREMLTLDLEAVDTFDAQRFTEELVAISRKVKEGSGLDGLRVALQLFAAEERDSKSKTCMVLNFYSNSGIRIAKGSYDPELGKFLVRPHNEYLVEEIIESLTIAASRCARDPSGRPSSLALMQKLVQPHRRLNDRVLNLGPIAAKFFTFLDAGIPAAHAARSAVTTIFDEPYVFSDQFSHGSDCVTVQRFDAQMMIGHPKWSQTERLWQEFRDQVDASIPLPVPVLT